MDEVNARIKKYALIVNPDLSDDEFLDFIVSDVVDRALIYMNRDQLVTDYEEALESDDLDGIDYPIPVRLERPLAMTVVLAYKTATERVIAETPSIRSIEDNGQKMSFGDAVTTYLATSDDNQIFGSTKTLLDKFRLAKIVENSTNFYR